MGKPQSCKNSRRIVATETKSMLEKAGTGKMVNENSCTSEKNGMEGEMAQPIGFHGKPETLRL